jgi:DNA-binding transcriptional MerR regulator
MSPDARLTLTELSQRARLPVPSIKLYLREEVLPRGDLGAPHRGYYGAAHLRRLELIVMLRDVAGLSLPAVRAVCRVLDADGGLPDGRSVARALDALGRGEERPRRRQRELSSARRELLGFLRGRGIRVRADAVAVAELAAAMVAMRRVVGLPLEARALGPHLDAATAQAGRELQASRGFAPAPPATSALAAVLWEPVHVLLRRIAHEHLGGYG